jgi:hypothetical protein
MCAAKAAGTYYAMQTPTGRSAIGSVSKEVFTDFFGIGDQNWSDFFATVALSAGVDYGIKSGIDVLTNAPTITAGNQPIDPNRLNDNDPIYGKFIANQGNSIAQGNVTVAAGRTGGQSFPLYDAQGDLVGIIGSNPAWSQGAVNGGLVTHTAVVLQSPGGQYYNSMRGLFTGGSDGAINLYGLTGVCHQMCNSAITQAGYAGTVSILMNGVRGSTIAQVLYGQHIGTSFINGFGYVNRREY